MSRLSRALVFRRTLPIAQIFLSAALLWTVRYDLMQEVKEAWSYWTMRYEPNQQVKEALSSRRTTENRATISDAVFSIIIPERAVDEPEEEFRRFEMEWKFERRKWLASVMNLPAGLIQLPYVILSQSREEWVPDGFDLMTWRALSWPLIGILFWWSAGRGVDALLALRRKQLAPKITIIEGVIGALLFSFCAIEAICFPLYGSSSYDTDFPTVLFSLGFAIWAVLGGIVILARWLQWRVANHSSLQA